MSAARARASFGSYAPADLVNRKEAASLLGLSFRSLEAWASTGTKGPPFIRLGEGPKAHVRYRVGDLLAWIDERSRASILCCTVPCESW